MCLIANNNIELANFLINNKWIFYISSLITIITTYALFCYIKNARTYP